MRRSWGGVWWAVGGAVFWVLFHGQGTTKRAKVTEGGAH